MHYEITLGDLPPLAELGGWWRELEARSPGSFFTSWTWIGTWLHSLEEGMRAQLLQAQHPDGRRVGLAVVVVRRQWRLGLPVLTGYLHETGRPDCDAITIEYNHLLVDAMDVRGISRAMVSALLARPSPVEEWRLSGLDHMPEWPQADLRLRRVVHESHQVDLVAVRAAEGGYLGLLRQRPRYLVRKSLKRLEASAPLKVTVAGDLADARRRFAELQDLHTRYWASRGEAGAYGSAFQRAFHTRLLDEAFERGELALLTVWHGEHALGHFQYFCRQGWVHYYQSGIDYARFDPQDSPGLAAHAMAIGHFQQAGAAVYDFMTGDYQYKRTLATQRSELAWLTVAPATLKMRAITALTQVARAARNRWRDRAARASPAAPEANRSDALPTSAP